MDSVLHKTNVRIKLAKIVSTDMRKNSLQQHQIMEKNSSHIPFSTSSKTSSQTFLLPGSAASNDAIGWKSSDEDDNNMIEQSLRNARKASLCAAAAAASTRPRRRKRTLSESTSSQMVESNSESLDSQISLHSHSSVVQQCSAQNNEECWNSDEHNDDPRAIERAIKFARRAAIKKARCETGGLRNDISRAHQAPSSTLADRVLQPIAYSCADERMKFGQNRTRSKRVKSTTTTASDEKSDDVLRPNTSMYWQSSIASRTSDATLRHTSHKQKRKHVEQTLTPNDPMMDIDELPMKNPRSVVNSINAELCLLRKAESSESPLQDPSNQLINVSKTDISSAANPISNSPNQATSVYLVLDTNFLLSHLRWLTHFKRHLVNRSISLVVPWVVIRELDALKKKTSSQIGALARQTNKQLLHWFNVADRTVVGEHIFEHVDDRAPASLGDYDWSNDDVVLRCTLKFRRLGYRGDYNCVFASLMPTCD